MCMCPRKCIQSLADEAGLLFLELGHEAGIGLDDGPLAPD